MKLEPILRISHRILPHINVPNLIMCIVGRETLVRINQAEIFRVAHIEVN
jgi:hypothetical protein